MNQENLRTATRFNISWLNSDPERVGPEIVSVFKETHRQQDDSYLLIQNSRLVDPEKRQPVKINRSFDLGRREGELFDLLENWAEKNEGGTAAWISPLYEGMYPCNKIIFYQLAYTFSFPPEKVLLSTTILFDTPKDHCLDIGKKLNPELKGAKDPEVLRKTLFTWDENFDLTKILEIISHKGKNSEPTPSQETVAYFVDLIKSGQDPHFIAQEMQRKGILGPHSISCPSIMSTFSDYMNTRSLTLDFSRGIKYVCCKCPVCLKEVVAEVYSGEIHCPKEKGGCGAKAPYQKRKIA